MKTPRLIVAIACLVLAGAVNSEAKEVVIYVSGPWIYAQDPNANDRVVVFVASAPNSHSPAQIFPGGDYMDSSGKPNLYQGLYRLDLPKAMSGQCKSSTNPYRLQEQLGITIGGAVIQDEVLNHKYDARIAVSLPKPACYIGKSTSESRVGTDPAKLAKDEYTTLMALHYFVADGPAHLSGPSDDGSVTLNDDIAFVSNSGPPAISLVEMAKDYKSDQKCDSYSHDSLEHSRRSLALGGKLFAQFPALKGDGSGQIKGKYNNCSSAEVDRNRERMAAAVETINEILAIRAYIADPSLQNDPAASLNSVKRNIELFFGNRDKVPSEISEEIEKAQKKIELIEDSTKKGRNETEEERTKAVLRRTEDVMTPYSVGGGDCHMAQISVGGIVPLK